MKILIKDKGAGKTTGLIYASEATGYPIVTSSKIQACYIKDQAERMECNIPEPLTVDEIRLNRVINHGSNILFDNVETVLEKALNEYLNANVVCVTMTTVLKENENYEEYNIEETEE